MSASSARKARYLADDSMDVLYTDARPSYQAHQTADRLHHQKVTGRDVTLLRHHSRRPGYLTGHHRMKEVY